MGPCEAFPDRAARVFVVDDDQSVRKALSRLLRTEGLDVEVFASGDEVLARADEAGCFVLDLQMPGLSGLDVHERLLGAGQCPSIVYLTGHGDVRSSVEAMRSGAVDFLEKPCDGERLIAAVRRALARDVQLRDARRRRSSLRERYRRLTPREREVMQLVASGLPNKLVAARLATSEKTVKIHRGRVMQKMGVASLAELVRAADGVAEVDD